MSINIFILVSFVLLIPLDSFSKTKVVATLPELKWIANELKVPQLETTSLLSGNEDPHFVDASPSFVLKIKNAELIIVNGLQLEMGWIPSAIEKAGNSKIQFQAKGYCDASQYVEKAQVTPNYNRSMGDIHPQGNPHYTLSLSQMSLAAKKIAQCLSSIAPSHQELIQKNLSKLQDDFAKKLGAQKEKLSFLKETSLMTYHLEFVYYLRDYNSESKGTIEKVPGVLPSSAHLFNISKLAKEMNVKLVLASITHPRKYLEKFKSMTKIPFIQMPMHMTSEFTSYWDYQNALATEIINNVKD